MVIVITVCKIIGIVVLALVAILAIVLFFPISYEAEADIDRQCCQIRVNWLFRLLRFRFSYTGKQEMALSFFLLKYDFLNQDKKEKRKIRKQRKANRKQKKKTDEEANRGAFARAVSFMRTAGHVLSMVSEYDLADAVWPGLQIFLYRIRPRQIRGELEFGIDDPSVTGQIVGGLALIPFLYQTDLRIIPDFETDKTYINGNAYLEGRMMLIQAVVFLIRLIRQKNVRLFIDGLRKKR